MKKYMAPTLSELLELEDILMSSQEDFEINDMGNDGHDEESPWNVD